MKRKLFALLLAALLALGTALCFAGCGSNNGAASTPSDPSTPSSPSSPSDTDPDGKTKPETPAEPSTPEEPDEEEDETPENPEEPEENPDDTPSDPPAEKFSLAANREKIIENFMILADYSAKTLLGNTTIVEKVFDLAIRYENSNTIIDTVHSGLFTQNSEYIQYATITFSNQILTYEQFANNDLQLSADNIKCKQNYYYSMVKEYKTKYANTIEKIAEKLFENYDDALWLGWTGTNLMQSDKHTVVCYGYNTSKQLYEIQQVTLTIPNDGATLTYPDGAVNKYFMNNQYQIHDTYNGKKSTFTLTLPEDTLNALIEKELREAEQE